MGQWTTSTALTTADVLARAVPSARDWLPELQSTSPYRLSDHLLLCSGLRACASDC